MRWALETGNHADVVLLDPLLTEAQREFYASDIAKTLLASGNATAARERARGREAKLKARLVTQPTNASIWMDLAETQMVLSQRDEALAGGRRAVELRPEATEAIDGSYMAVSMAGIDAWTGDTERALA